MQATQSPFWMPISIFICFDFNPASLSCSFSSGDGRATSKENIGQETGAECVQACIAWKKKDESINGVTTFQNEMGGCWCEKEMAGTFKSSTYKTCFLKTSGNVINIPISFWCQNYQTSLLNIR